LTGKTRRPTTERSLTKEIGLAGRSGGRIQKRVETLRRRKYTLAQNVRTVE
jgi:hypothetical protein